MYFFSVETLSKIAVENKVMAIKNNPIKRDQKIFNSIILPLDKKIQNK
jgi:hypothetical protein